MCIKGYKLQWVKMLSKSIKCIPQSRTSSLRSLLRRLGETSDSHSRPQGPPFLLVTWLARRGGSGSALVTLTTGCRENSRHPVAHGW